ncbi:hypothetical protein SapgrDRAFT_2997 [Saprospira grandis DSM 2844]|uniref:Uncharacterized protein n=1 Tax=Saprospira grandis DSM 2844 TaxID=694433 RepID=J0XZN2_9BACT|nr:hypothetical protein SapgrDRAFT_2997 [Saprospira grandis DSM 2844]
MNCYLFYCNLWFWGPRPASLRLARPPLCCGAHKSVRPFRLHFVSPSVWPDGHPSAALGRSTFISSWGALLWPLVAPLKWHSSLRSSSVMTTPPTRPSSGFPKESLRGTFGGAFYGPKAKGQNFSRIQNHFFSLEPRRYRLGSFLLS